MMTPNQETNGPAGEELFAHLPKGWEYTTLGRACERGGGNIQTGPFGSQLHASDYVPVGVPSIMPQNIGDNQISVDGVARISPSDAERLSRYLVREGDIVYSRRGDVERRALIRAREDGWLCGTGCLRVRLGENGVDSTYGSYFLGHPRVREWITRHALGATMANLNTSILSACPFVIPPKDEQHAIGQILSTLDHKIETNRRMNNTLEAKARRIFKDWFVDFGPTRAKAEGRAQYLAPDLWELFPDTLDAGDKPNQWSVRPANELFEFNPRESVQKGTRTPYLDMAAVPTLGAAANAPIHREYKSGSKFRDGDTLFARITPCLENGKTAYVFGLGKGVVGTGSTEFIVIRSRAPVPKPTSYLLARDAEFRAYAERSMTGTSGRQRASLEALAHYQLAVPHDDRLWKALGDLIHPLIDRVIANARASRTLVQTRDLLLPKLMSGRIRLREAEKAVQAVA